MIVKIKKDCQTLLGNHQTGDEIDLPEAIAQKLLDRGFAEMPGATKKSSKKGD